jgi:hypothetical protein
MDGQQAAQQQQQQRLQPGSSANSSLVMQPFQPMRGESASVRGTANVLQLPRPPGVMSHSSPGRPMISPRQQQQQQNAPVTHSWSGQRASAVAMHRLQVPGPGRGTGHISRSLTGLPDDHQDMQMQQHSSRHGVPAMMRRLPAAQTAWQATGDAGSTTAAAAGFEEGGSRLGAALAPSPRQYQLDLSEDSAADHQAAAAGTERARSPFSAAAAASWGVVQQRSVSPAAAAQQRLVKNQLGTRGGSSSRVTAAALSEDDGGLAQQAVGQLAKDGGMQRQIARRVPAAAAAALGEGGGAARQPILQHRASPQAKGK